MRLFLPVVVARLAAPGTLPPALLKVPQVVAGHPPPPPSALPGHHPLAAEEALEVLLLLLLLPLLLGDTVPAEQDCQNDEALILFMAKERDK